MLITATAVGAPAWTWVDQDGHRHYSDRPVPGAERIDLPSSQTYTRTRSQTADAAPTGPTPAESSQVPSAAQAYTAFNILSPTHEQTLWNIGAILPVQVELEPALQDQHRLDAILDGERIEIGARNGQFTVPDVFRGLHRLQAVIVDTAGQEVLRSREITIMVQQTSIANSNNPNAASLNNANR